MTNGIKYCQNCVGLHPDELPDFKHIHGMIKDPSKTVGAKILGFDNKRLLQYANKSCMLCGRSYKFDGQLDETWEITASRVKQEFEAVYITLPDDVVKLVVASCRKAFLYAFENRERLSMHQLERLSFAGHIAWLMTIAQTYDVGKMKHAMERGLKPK